MSRQIKQQYLKGKLLATVFNIPNDQSFVIWWGHQHTSCKREDHIWSSRRLSNKTTKILMVSTWTSKNATSDSMIVHTNTKMHASAESNLLLAFRAVTAPFLMKNCKL